MEKVAAISLRFPPTSRFMFIPRSGRLRRAGSLASLTDQTQWTTSNFGSSTNQVMVLAVTLHTFWFKVSTDRSTAFRDLFNVVMFNYSYENCEWSYSY